MLSGNLTKRGSRRKENKMDRLTTVDGAGVVELVSCMDCNIAKDSKGLEPCSYCDTPYEAYKKLAAYEDAEEQGHMVLIPNDGESHVYIIAGSERSEFACEYKRCPRQKGEDDSDSVCESLIYEADFKEKSELDAYGITKAKRLPLPNPFCRETYSRRSF